MQLQLQGYHTTILSIIMLFIGVYCNLAKKRMLKVSNRYYTDCLSHHIFTSSRVILCHSRGNIACEIINNIEHRGWGDSAKGEICRFGGLNSKVFTWDLPPPEGPVRYSTHPILMTSSNAVSKVKVFVCVCVCVCVCVHMHCIMEEGGGVIHMNRMCTYNMCTCSYIVLAMCDCIL